MPLTLTLAPGGKWGTRNQGKGIQSKLQRQAGLIFGLTSSPGGEAGLHRKYKVPG